MLGNKNFGFLVESVNLLHHLISRYRNLSSSFARQIAKTSQQTQPNLSIIRTVIGFQIPPQFFLLLKTLIRLRLNQENTGYRPCSESVRIEATSASFKLSTFTVSLSLFSVFLNRSERVLVSSVRSAASSDFKASVTSASIRLN